MYSFKSSRDTALHSRNNSGASATRKSFPFILYTCGWSGSYESGWLLFGWPFDLCERSAMRLGWSWAHTNTRTDTWKRKDSSQASISVDMLEYRQTQQRRRDGIIYSIRYKLLFSIPRFVVRIVVVAVFQVVVGFAVFMLWLCLCLSLCVCVWWMINKTRSRQNAFDETVSYCFIHIVCSAQCRVWDSRVSPFVNAFLACHYVKSSKICPDSYAYQWQSEQKT